MVAQNQPRCTYRSPSRRRCSNKAAIGWDVCDKHCHYFWTRAAADEIVSNRDRLDTAEGIHAVMERIIRAQATRKILSRDATAMIYSCQAKLYVLPRLAAERGKVFVAKEEDVWREKALADSHHDKLNCDAAPVDDEDEKK